jgi:helicase MOV-10
MSTSAMQGVSMTLQGKNLKLSVPGLSEKRPSVLKGDKIIVKMTNGDDQEYEGFVHEVQNTDILVGFSSELHTK